MCRCICRRTKHSLRCSQAADEVVFDGASGQTEFEFVFDQDTEVTGYAKLKVWIEARGASGSDTPPDDLVLCCFVDKRDRSGGSVRFNGAVSQAEDMVTRGYGRAARRALNTAESRPWHPVLSGDKHEPIKPGETVPLEIAFCPSSTFFTKGERLRLIISAKDIVHAPIFKKDTSVNRGATLFTSAKTTIPICCYQQFQLATVDRHFSSIELKQSFPFDVRLAL